MTHDETTERLARAVLATMPEQVDPDRIAAQIDARLTRRRRQRRTRRTAGASMVAAVLVAAVALAVERPVEIETATETPDRSASTWTVEPTIVAIPGRGDRIVVAAADADGAWFVRGEPAGANRAAPDTVARIGLDGSVGPVTELRGVATVGVADERWLWVLADERPDLPTGAWRLKQIDRATGRLEGSYVLDLEDRPHAITVEDELVIVHDPGADSVLDRTGEMVERRSPTVAPTRPGPVLPEPMVIEGGSVGLKG